MRPLSVACVLLLSTALSAQSPAPTPPETRPSFTEWLSSLRAEALARGIKPEIVEQALGGVEEPLPVVIDRDRTQAETVLPLETYITRRLTNTLVRRGRQMVTRFRPALERISQEYGVPVRIIAGIWGVESNFGGFSGTRPTVPALATLAWDPRRSALFRRELFDALEILNRGDIDAGRMRGSWAGAMGQPQFMPSSYLQFAVDHDGDGRRDIWESQEDVFASIANYLKGHGWTTGQAWGREVTLSKDAARHVASTVGRRGGSCSARRDMTVTLPLDEWQQRGVRTLGGGALPKSDMQASLVSGSRRHFLVYANYDALLEYNCAHAYALAVVLLGDRISDAASVGAAPPARTPTTQRDQAPADGTP